MSDKILAFSVLPLIDNFDVSYLKKLKEIGLDTVHYDVMDEFTGTTGFDVNYLPVLNEIGFQINIHLMVNKIATTLTRFAKYPATRISFHAEALPTAQDGKRYLEFIKNHGAQAGLAFKMDTDLRKYIELLKAVDYVTLMSVNPGKGGQVFNQHVFKNILQLIKLSREFNFKQPVVEFDGGINAQALHELWIYGDIFVSGSAFHKLSLEDKTQLLKAVKNNTFNDNFKGVNTK